MESEPPTLGPTVVIGAAQVVLATRLEAAGHKAVSCTVGATEAAAARPRVIIIYQFVRI